MDRYAPILGQLSNAGVQFPHPIRAARAGGRHVLQNQHVRPKSFEYGRDAHKTPLILVPPAYLSRSPINR